MAEKRVRAIQQSTFVILRVCPDTISRVPEIGLVARRKFGLVKKRSVKVSDKYLRFYRKLT